MSFIFLRKIGVGELYQKRRVIVGLHLVVSFRTANHTFVGYNEAFFGVGGHGDGTHETAASRSSVTGVYVKVTGIKAKGTMVSGAVSQGRNLSLAVAADKSAVIFCKGLVFHTDKSKTNVKILKMGFYFSLEYSIIHP